jgi:uncharacterized protein with HEPN domain
MQRRDAASLLDVLQAGRLVVRFVEGLDREAFSADVMRQSAVSRQLEIMGEATKRLSMSFREAHPGIPWRDMAGMRDVLIHGYDAVDEVQLWSAATVSVPSILPALEQIAGEIDPAEAVEEGTGEESRGEHID